MMNNSLSTLYNNVILDNDVQECVYYFWLSLGSMSDRSIETAANNGLKTTKNDGLFTEE
jgi:hypothetical protein